MMQELLHLKNVWKWFFFQKRFESVFYLIQFILELQMQHSPGSNTPLFPQSNIFSRSPEINYRESRLYNKNVNITYLNIIL